MRHVDRLIDFISSLDRDQCRVRRPDPFIFFCGGPIGLGDPILSLRDYILQRHLQLQFRTVLAEQAVNIFEVSHYEDLITFEAHIAQISELVLLICEGPGAVAELGAFSQHPVIRERLYVILREDHYNAKSFIRLGPIKSLLDWKEEKVGSFPWSVDLAGNLITQSLDGFDNVICDEINSQLRPSDTEALDWNNQGHQIIFIYWICFMLRSATIGEIENCLRRSGYELPQTRVKQYLYCMRVAGWIEERNLGKIYYIPHFDKDPLNYSFTAKEDNNKTKPDKAKADIARIIMEDKLRSSRVMAAIGAGDETPVFLDGQR